MEIIILIIFLLYILLKVKSRKNIATALKNGNIEDVQCPCCGYYCSGNGGIGCINKPKLFKEQELKK